MWEVGQFPVVIFLHPHCFKKHRARKNHKTNEKKTAEQNPNIPGVVLTNNDMSAFWKYGNGLVQHFHVNLCIKKKGVLFEISISLDSVLKTNKKPQKKH